MVHAVALLLITVFFGRWIAYVPLATLAAILVFVAYHMSQWRSFVAEFRAPKSDVAVMMVTFLLTVFIDLVVAIEVGMVLAAFLFMRRMAEVTNVSALRRELDGETRPGQTAGHSIPPGVELYEIDGPFFFGAAEKFKETMGRVEKPPRVLVLELSRVSAMDSTALHALRTVLRRAQGDRTRVCLVGVHAQPMMALARAGVLEEVGEKNLFGDLNQALTALAADAAAAPDVSSPRSASLRH
jgi:SulP family sulfate permease